LATLRAIFVFETVIDFGGHGTQLMYQCLGFA
jgi:hypothetical protein